MSVVVELAAVKQNKGNQSNKNSNVMVHCVRNTCYPVVNFGSTPGNTQFFVDLMKTSGSGMLWHRTARPGKVDNLRLTNLMQCCGKLSL